MKKNVLAVAAGLFVAAIMGGAAFAAVVNGSNVVSVESCRGTNNQGVIIRRSGALYQLNAGCYDAGHGLRQYTFQCNGAKQYRVQWTNCRSGASAPAIKPTPAVQPTPKPATPAPAPTKPAESHDDHDHDEESKAGHAGKSCRTNAECNDGLAYTMDWCHLSGSEGDCHNDTVQCTSNSQCQSRGLSGYTCGSPFGASAPKFCTK